jgi:hypothetical protein
MQFSKHLLMLAAGLSLLAVVAGCGGEPKLQTATVTGTVTYKGEVLKTGDVTFIPVTAGPAAMGSIGPDGKYTLQTAGQPGAVPGKYRVAIVAVEVTPGLPEDPNAGSRQLIPEKYGSDSTSGLEREVVADKENVIDFTLED